MTLIKEYATYSKVVILREDMYGSSLEKFLRLYDEAKKDFPDLSPEEVIIIHYAGQRYAKTFGIEFSWTEDVPDSYTRIEQVEMSY